MGSPALTSRGFVERDFEQVADFVDRAVRIAGMVLCVCMCARACACASPC